LIEFEGVTKVFQGGTVAVDDISLVAPAGRITVLMGPRGCGKSTLLRMVNRMLDPSAGRVLINGAPNTNVRRSHLRRGIGYLAVGGLFPHRTVARNIATVPLLLGFDRGSADQRAAALLEHVGLPASFADKYPGQLSRGQQVRVGLARALAADPPVLLLDAPFTALEPAVRQDIQDDLLELQRIAPKTILLATEDIDEAIKLGDQIAVMESGRIVQLATPQVMLSYPGSDYVAELLGRDRGIRKLTFLPAGDLPLTPAATVQAGTTGSRARAIADSQHQRWLLVLDPDRRPRGWVDSAVLGPDQIVSGPVVHPLGGTFYPDESVLAALDAAILSPPGLAVCLDDDGKTLGVVSHTEIARHLQSLPPVPGQAAGESPRFDATPTPARGFGESSRRVPEPVVEPIVTPEPVIEPVVARAPEPVFAKPVEEKPAPEPVRAPEPVFAKPVEEKPAPEPVVVAKQPEPEPVRQTPKPVEETAVLPPVAAEKVEKPVVEEKQPEPTPVAESPPVRREPPTAPMPVVKETSKPTAPVAVPASSSAPRPVQARPVNGPSEPAAPAARTNPVPAPSERRTETNGESMGGTPAPAAAPAAATPAAVPAAKTEETPRRSSVAGGWEWRSDLGQWVQVEPDAAGATAGDGSNR
jgi:osmoprotectant transport system ATP-binding protein